MRAYLHLFLVLGVIARRGEAQRPASEAQLEAITARGRMLADYDAAAWKASDDVMALTPRPGTITHYIARRSERGWQVNFGHLSATRDAFLVVYVAAQRTDSPSFKVTVEDPPRPDTDYLLHAARATDVARSMLQAKERPYNVAVLPAPGGEWWVYLYPAQTQEGVWPLGADVRYRVSADGARIREERHLHRTIIEYGPMPSGRTAIAMTHTAILDEVPEDTDVLMVLRRQPAVPEIVVTHSFAYRIEIDGAIHYLGRREDLKGREKQ